MDELRLHLQQGLGPGRIVVMTPAGRATHLVDGEQLGATRCGATWRRTRLAAAIDPTCAWCRATLELEGEARAQATYDRTQAMIEAERA